MFVVRACCPQTAGSDPDDLAALLKRFLRDLAEPLIPSHLNDSLQAASASLHRASTRSASQPTWHTPASPEAAAASHRLLDLCHELPPHNWQMLQRLVRTLALAAKSRRVKMDAGALAICLAPCVSRPPCHPASLSPSVAVGMTLTLACLAHAPPA